METTLATDVVSQTALYTAIWVEYGICTVVMILRAYSQFFLLRKFSADDVVMLGAYLCQGVASALCTTSAYWGLGSSITDLSYTEIVHVLKYAMISMPFGVFAPLLGRISFILFLLASVVTVHKLRRKLLWTLIGLQVVINIIPIILQFTQCDPVSALWNPLQLLSSCQGAVVVQRYGYFQGAFNALTDLILIMIGLAVIVSLKMRLSNKIVLASILSLSLLAMIAAILKTTQIRIMNTVNFSYALGLWTIWFLTEGTVVIVTASVPRLRAIIVLRRHAKSSYNNAYTPSDSNRPPPAYEDQDRSHKLRSVRMTDMETSLDDAPIFTHRVRSDNANASLEAVPLELESGISLGRNRAVEEASRL
ncbi:hypothetical protein BDW59DRAFT_179574 [Aspergillus cavernicola]|uniref:Rhodopsin domain-containing protein n=1 Tax=Aspergillus cavernicola TaxID=176166 RepID=A0ABR4IHX6_9EURO